MKRNSKKKKGFKSKKPSRVSIDVPVPAASTSTSTGTWHDTDLMPSIPACDSDGATSALAQDAAGVSVSV